LVFTTHAPSVVIFTQSPCSASTLLVGRPEGHPAYEMSLLQQRAIPRSAAYEDPALPVVISV